MTLLFGAFAIVAIVSAPWAYMESYPGVFCSARTRSPFGWLWEQVPTTYSE